MADNADLTTNKRKQPEQASNDFSELKRSKTALLDEVADNGQADDKTAQPKDNIALDNDKDEEQEKEDNEEGEEDNDDDERDESGDEKASKPHSSSSSSNKAESSSKATGLSDDDDNGISDGELEALDTSLIINTGRRTRGKKIDYTQFGADTPADEE